MMLASGHWALPEIENNHRVTVERASLNAAFDDLEYGLIGLDDAKRRLCAILAEAMATRARATIGAVTGAAPLHMLFTGNPGTGKTIFAQKTAELLHRLGCIESNRLTMAAGTELMGQYAGHAAARATELIRRARGGVLFIDDAYLLNRPEAETDFGREAIDVLTDAMRNPADGLVVILAGAGSKMDALFADAPRLRFGIAHHIHFADYTQQELLAIAESMLDEMNFRLEPAARGALAEFLKRRTQEPHFANARSVRHALDRARLRQSSRLFTQSLAGQPLDPAAMVRIVDADLPTPAHP